MATRALGVVRSDNRMVTLLGEKVRNREVGQASGLMPAATIFPERRCEARMEYRCLCSFEVLEICDEALVVIEQGEAFALNRSTEGVLLFLGRSLHTNQLIKVYSTRSGWDWIGSFFESRWAKPVHVESLGNLYLVGCRQKSPFVPTYHSNAPPIQPRLKAHTFS